MNRRKTLLGLAALATSPRISSAQPAAKVFRVGSLQGGTSESTLHLVKAFEDGLGELGYRVGQNIVIEYRFADATLDRLPALAAELVRLNVDAILTGTNQSTVAARNATTTIPIVMTLGNDLVKAGLIASLARPGGNLTGMSADTGEEFSGKKLQLLKEMVPKLTRVAILEPANFPANSGRRQSTLDAAPKLGLQVLPFVVNGPGDLEPALEAIVKWRAQALFVFIESMMFTHRNQIGALATRHRLPAIADVKELAAAGLLMTYGVDLRDQWRRAAGHVAKILQGANPAEMPVEQPIKFELVINGKTAKALGIKLSQSMLIQANEVLE